MANRIKWTERTKSRFLEVLRESCNVSEAIRACGMSRARIYELRDEDQGFRAEWDDAIEEAIDRLEREAWRRAHDGYDQPIFQRGEQVGVVRKYSDALMTLLLRAHRPKKYRERFEHDVAEDSPISRFLKSIDGKSLGPPSTRTSED